MRRHTTKPTTLPPQQRAWSEHRMPEGPIERAAMRGPAVCQVCGAVWRTKRWYAGENAPPDAKTVTCPACRLVAEGGYSGHVILQEPATPEERKELRHLIAHVANDTRQDNPQARIVGMQEHDDTLVVTTTTEFLAERLGKAIQHAFKGTLVLRHPPDGVVEVRWSPKPTA